MSVLSYIILVALINFSYRNFKGDVQLIYNIGYLIKNNTDKNRDGRPKTRSALPPGARGVKVGRRRCRSNDVLVGARGRSLYKIFERKQ